MLQMSTSSPPDICLVLGYLQHAIGWIGLGGTVAKLPVPCAAFTQLNSGVSGY